jgi:hypothetical protein
MLNEILELGFDQVELSHGVRQSLWEGIPRFLADHPMVVTSLHNFCPLPVEIQGAAPIVTSVLLRTQPNATEPNISRSRPLITLTGSAPSEWSCTSDRLSYPTIRIA